MTFYIKYIYIIFNVNGDRKTNGKRKLWLTWSLRWLWACSWSPPSWLSLELTGRGTTTCSSSCWSLSLSLQQWHGTWWGLHGGLSPSLPMAWPCCIISWETNKIVSSQKEKLATTLAKSFSSWSFTSSLRVPSWRSVFCVSSRNGHGILPLSGCLWLRSESACSSAEFATNLAKSNMALHSRVSIPHKKILRIDAPP